MIVISAKPAHLDHIEATMRPDDVRECTEQGYMDVRAALITGILASDRPLTITDNDGLPLAMGGVCPGNVPNLGYCWLLASTDIEKHKVEFLRISRPWVDDLNKEYPVLTNKVGSWNKLHIRWLQWCGFTLINPQSTGLVEFVRINKCAHQS